jgi:hypothetical protein
VGANVKKVINTEDSVRASREDIKTRPANAEEGTKSSTRESLFALASEQYNTQGKRVMNGESVREIVKMSSRFLMRCRRGIVLFVELAKILKWKQVITIGVLEGFENLRGVACAWGIFAEYLQMEDEACDQLDTEPSRVLVYLDFFQWLQTEGPIMEGDGEIKPLAPATIKTYKSSVASLFRCIWKQDVAADPIAKKVSKAFCRNHPSSPKYFDMWDAQLILDFYRSSKPPSDVKERARYIWQRAAVLVLFFGILRIKELITLDWRRVKQDEEGLMLQVITKSDNEHYVPVFLPKLGGVIRNRNDFYRLSKGEGVVKTDNFSGN